MSEIVKAPAWLISKSGEVLTEKFMEWIQSTQKKLLRAFPPSERAFCRIISKMTSRLPSRWGTRLWYTRQKYFKVADGVVFFGDFYFRNLKMLIEVDGASHSGPAAREKDEWREKLIGIWKVKTFRIMNDQVTSWDFREVEKWFVESSVSACPYISRKLPVDYVRMKDEHPHIYTLAETLTTYSPR